MIFQSASHEMLSWLLVRQNIDWKWLAFDCPCRTGHRIIVPLDRAAKPRWSIIRENPLTVGPSFDSRMNRKNCHFFIRDGRIEWAR